jgi:hypothetical protein
MIYKAQCRSTLPALFGFMNPRFNPGIRFFQVNFVISLDIGDIKCHQIDFLRGNKYKFNLVRIVVRSKIKLGWFNFRVI